MLVVDDIEAVLFDKDGTLIDFHRTWDAAVGRALKASAPDDASLARAAEALAFDLTTGRVGPESPFIAESNDVIAALLDSLLDLGAFDRALSASAREDVAPATGAASLLDSLSGAGVPAAVVTNDDEATARVQMEALGWGDFFAAIVGFDSGFGAKPGPGPIVGACSLLGIEPARAVMVGDSRHDLVAGRAAEVSTVLVTNESANGLPTPRGDSADLADLVISRLDELEQILLLG